MAEGNGVDLGALVEMVKGLVVAVDRVGASQERMTLDLQDLRRQFATLSRDVATLRRDGAALGKDVVTLRQDVVSLRHDVVTYHASVMGHGSFLTELDERVTRLEAARRPGHG